MSYNDSLIALDIQSHEAICLQTDFVTPYQIIHGLVDVWPVSAGLHLRANATRVTSLRLYPQYVKKSFVAPMYYFHLPSIWNSLPSHIIQCQTV